MARSGVGNDRLRRLGRLRYRHGRHTGLFRCRNGSGCGRWCRGRRRTT
jgi:hypothetical protein